MTKTNLPYRLFPPLPDPEASRVPHCPICGEEAETFYIDRWGMTVGCGSCISAKHKKPSPPAVPASGKTASDSKHRNMKGGGRKDETGLCL